MKKMEDKIEAVKWIRSHCDWKRFKKNRRRHTPCQSLLQFIVKTPVELLVSEAFIWDEDKGYNWFEFSCQYEDYLSRKANTPKPDMPWRCHLCGDVLEWEHSDNGEHIWKENPEMHHLVLLQWKCPHCGATYDVVADKERWQRCL